MTNQNSPIISNPFDSSVAWNYYINLENEFLECLKYIPFQTEHFEVWSPVFGNILNNTGSVVDSFCKSVLFSPFFDDDDNIENYRENNPPTMKTYRDFLEAKYHLSKKKIFVLSTSFPIMPFTEWSEGKRTSWWKNYTILKHDRFSNIQKGTLKTTCDALGALFLLNVIHRETRSILLRDGYIHPLTPFFSDASLFNILDYEPLKGDVKVRVQSRLFGYMYENSIREFSDLEIINYLSPWAKTYPGVTPRLKKSI